MRIYDSDQTGKTYLARISSLFLVILSCARAQNGTFIPSAPVIYQMSSDPDFALQLEVTISLSEYYGANTGEVLRAASQITAGNFKSWYQAYSYLGNAIQAYADGLDSEKYPVSARDAYFRSSSYLRDSLFFLTGNVSDPRLYTVWDQAITNFNKANALLRFPGVRYNIPAPLEARSNFTAPIIMWKPDDTNTSRPTVLWGSGYDAPMENGFHIFARWVLERGWNFVVYEGPGQNTVRRDQNIGFQPDWWKVVSPIVSFLSNRSDVDTSRIALVGESFGGVLTTRAATREHRLAAVLIIDGAISIDQSFFSQAPQLVAVFNNSATHFDETLNGLRNNVSSSTSLRWGINQGLFSFNTDSLHEWLELAANINFTKDDVAEITMPAFVGSGQNDTGFPHQAPVVQGWFGDKAFSYEFLDVLGAGQHCQVGAESQLTTIPLDWLQDVFANATEPMHAN